MILNECVRHQIDSELRDDQITRAIAGEGHRRSTIVAVDARRLCNSELQSATD